jgi:hypothetical protein
MTYVRFRLLKKACEEIYELMKFNIHMNIKVTTV